VIGLAFEIEKPGAIGDDASPGIDAARFGQRIDA